MKCGKLPITLWADDAVIGVCQKPILNHCAINTRRHAFNRDIHVMFNMDVLFYLIRFNVLNGQAGDDGAGFIMILAQIHFGKRAVAIDGCKLIT